MKFYQILILVFLSFVFIGCGGGGSSSTQESGTLSLSLSDAPLADDENVTGVYISITGIEYHTDEDGWQSMGDFNTSINPINLLEWQNGKVISLGDFVLPAGKYTQMRFLLDAVEETEKPKSNTGCYIEINDVNETLYVPSGSTTGYKAVGSYEVPVNGTVEMTADFDVRKSVVVAGGGSYYKLKPTIKLVVTDQAGEIEGSVSNLDANNSYIVYAYSYDETNTSTWNESQLVGDDSTDSENIRFSDVSASAKVDDNATYTLPFLAHGIYDLIAAEYDSDGNYINYTIQTNVEVMSEQTTVQNLTF